MDANKVKNIKDLVIYCKEKGNRFFSGENMRFFNSKIETELLENKYFITSEQTNDLNDIYIKQSQRMFTIRHFDSAKSWGYIIATKFKFMQFAMLKEALEAIDQAKDL